MTPPDMIQHDPNAFRADAMAASDAARGALRPDLAACFTCRPSTGAEQEQARPAGVLADLAKPEGRD